jgi:glycolate oxidase FAD binding subunit
MGAALDALGLPFREEEVRVPGGAVGRVAAPERVEELEAIVRAASEDLDGLLVMGGRTRLDLANPVGAVSLGISLESMSEIDEFDPDEGVLHAGAGTPIPKIREAVAAEGWELALDTPGATSTIGGTIASGVTGPRAHGFGPVKDAILGLEVVGGDGVATKCGGRVVKNVTGYDLAKLYCGSFGTLAIVTGAWLRLRPTPAERRAIVATVPAEEAAFEAIRKLGERPSVRASIWRESPESGPGARLLVELGGSGAGVEADLAAFREIASFDDASTTDVDLARDELLATGPDVVLRARVLGTNVAAFKSAALAAGLEVLVESGPGVVRARGALRSVEVLLGLRETAVRLGGFATFERIPEEWRPELDVFGDVGGALEIVSALARRFDPSGILNPGRFVGSGAAGRGA